MLTEKRLRAATEDALKDLRFRISEELGCRREEATRRVEDASVRVLEEHATPTGSYQWQMRRCGHADRCQRCKKGLLHGPYLYRFFSKDGKQKSEYISLSRAASLGFERPPAPHVHKR